MRCECSCKTGNMQMWQPGSCFPISLLFTFITSLLLTRRPATLSIAEPDFLDLCEQKVHSVYSLAFGGILLNKRQCLDLSAKLSKAFHNIRELVSHSGASSTVFRPALENLYRILEKAKMLVSDCCHENWSASSVFQIQNERAFQEILLDVGLCYNAIYEQAEGASKERNFQLEDLRGSPTFDHASASDIDEDHRALQKKLSELARGPNSTSSSVLDCLLPRRLCLKQHLAQYLLVKLNCASEQSHGRDEGKSNAILWHGATEPSGTWGNHRFLGSGSGASGVMRTKWLGISCAKKVFPGRIDGSLFTKEAGILADLNHPRVVKFFCCGSCQDQKDDCFIAMELMEMSLDSLIKERKEQQQPFPLPVAIDIIVQIARGMCYLHEVKVAHRDLKPLNVVVNRLTYPNLNDEYFCVKLVDFGMSKTKVEVHKANTISQPGVGTTSYRAPEVHPKAHLDGEKLKARWFKADVYSFAVTCAQILTLEQPYEDIPNGLLFEELINGRRPMVNDCPPDLVLLLNACWHRTPSRRPPFKTICSKLENFSHKFLRMKMGKPFPVRSPSVPRTDDDGVEEIQTLEDLRTSSSTPAASSGCSASDSKEVEPCNGDPHKDAQALEPTAKLAKVASSEGKGSAASKSRRKCKDKAGVDKPQTIETKKMTPETAISQFNGGEFKKPKGKKIDFETQSEPPMKLNSGKRSKRKQALDDIPVDTPLGKARSEAVPTSEKKKRRRRDAEKKLGESPKIMEGANLQELLACTVSLDRGAFQPVYGHVRNGDDAEEITVVYRRPAVPPVKKSRVRRRKNSGIGASI